MICPSRLQSRIEASHIGRPWRLIFSWKWLRERLGYRRKLGRYPAGPSRGHLGSPKRSDLELIVKANFLGSPLWYWEPYWEVSIGLSHFHHGRGGRRAGSEYLVLPMTCACDNLEKNPRFPELHTNLSNNTPRGAPVLCLPQIAQFLHAVVAVDVWHMMRKDFLRLAHGNPSFHDFLFLHFGDTCFWRLAAHFCPFHSSHVHYQPCECKHSLCSRRHGAGMPSRTWTWCAGCHLVVASFRAHPFSFPLQAY